MVSTMPTREELKLLTEQLPDEALDRVHRMLQFHLNPPKPAIERMQQRNMQYRQAVLARVRDSRKPGTMALGGGSGFTGSHAEVHFSRQSFHHWDEKTLVRQSLQAFDGQEIEIVERLSFCSDRKEFNCVLELTSGGRTLRHEDRFPVVMRDLEA